MSPKEATARGHARRSKVINLHIVNAPSSFTPVCCPAATCEAMLLLPILTSQQCVRVARLCDAFVKIRG